MKWIFSPITDLSFMLVGPLVFAMGYYSSYVPALFTVPLFFIALVLFDSGHVYLTYVRIVKEWKQIKYSAVTLHITLFIVFYLLQFFKVNYLWHFVVYATFFHFLRQFYGVMRWYLFLKENKHSYILDLLFYLTTITPILCMHFRSDLPVIGYYATVDTFHYASDQLLNTFKLVNSGAVLSWIAYELWFYYKFRDFELSRVLYLALTIALFNVVSFYSKGASTIILPLVSAHGLQYYLLLGQMVNKFHFRSLFKTIFIVSVTGLTLGYLNGWAEEEINLTYSYLFSHDLLNILAVALLLTPLFVHYILDMLIWKRRFMEKLA